MEQLQKQLTDWQNPVSFWLLWRSFMLMYNGYSVNDIFVQYLAIRK